MEFASTALAHDRVQQMFGPLVDHELGPTEEVALRTHLDHCTECMQGFERYQRAVSLVRGAPHEQVPADFAHRVLKRIRKRRHSLFGFHGGRLLEQWNVPGEAVVAVLIAALVAAILLMTLP